MKYRDIPKFNENILKELDATDPDRVIMALLSIVMDSGDFDLSVHSVRRFLHHENEYVRGIACESCSHIARIWKKLPHDLVNHVDVAIRDSSLWVQGKAEFAIDDFEVFLDGYKRPGIIE